MVDTTAPPRPPTAPSRLPLVVAGVALLAVVVTAAALRMNRPLAISEDPGAAAKYAEGLRHQVEMDIDGMNASLRAAIERDPGLAGAHLRIAVWALDDPSLAREHLAAAGRHRDRLDEHDLALMEGLSASVGAVVDVPASVEKTRAGFERFKSPEHRFQAARALHIAGRHAEARTLAEGGDVAGFLPLSFVAGASALQEPGMEAVGVAHLRRCIDGSPAAKRCRLTLERYEQRTGRDGSHDP